MNDEFQVWVLLVGLAVGAALAWFALGSGSRALDPSSFETADERALEAAWLARELDRQGRPVELETLENVLALDRALAAGLAGAPGALADPGPFAGPGEVSPPGDAQ